ncbi:MAG: hypothetical protein ACLFVX_10925 [Archaeoglobaceae archaeon]
MITLVNTISEGGIGTATTIGLVWGGLFATIFLIMLLSSKEIISASDIYDRTVEHSLNMSILPLLFVFFAIVAFKVIEVLY